MIRPLIPEKNGCQVPLTKCFLSNIIKYVLGLLDFHGAYKILFAVHLKHYNADI
jgi:hypothetical protein